MGFADALFGGSAFPERASFSGLGERPRRIADGVALAIRQWLETAHAA